MTPETVCEDGLAVGPLDDEEGEDDCRPRPQATVRQLMALRLVERA